MSRYCKCVGWSEKYQCRDGISWNGDGEEFQAHPPGERCRCSDDCCWVNCQCTVQEVPPVGTFLVVDGVVTQVHRVRKEADFLLNRCEPGDPCGAEDGCNT
jgi:hypothetical protein